MKTFQNFYEETYGIWKICPEPNRTPDFKSEKSASKYWDCGEYVVRKSNHWGVVGSCFWRIDGTKKKQVLNLEQAVCAMIHYKDFGPAKTPKKFPTKETFVKVQPHIIHDGPITVELTDGIIQKLNAAAEEILSYSPTSDELDLVGPDWILCQADWHAILRYASQRLSSIIKKLPYKEANEEDRKCINISLSILADYAEGKETRFMIEKTEDA